MATLNEKQEELVSKFELKGRFTLYAITEFAQELLDLATPPEPLQGECPKCTDIKENENFYKSWKETEEKLSELRRELAKKVMQVVFIQEGENQWVNLSEVLKIIEGE